jgi:hypothetical protein
MEQEHSLWLTADKQYTIYHIYNYNFVLEALH